MRQIPLVNGNGQQQESDAGFRQAHFMLSLNPIEEFQGCINIKKETHPFQMEGWV